MENDKLDYQRRMFKYLPICFNVSMIKIGFQFDKTKKIKSLENSDDIAYQITGRNNNTFGITTANLEVKRWSYDHKLFQFGAI